jgi:hypothetical protein
MANVGGQFYSGTKGRSGTSPESPSDLEGVQPYPVNPPGSNSLADFVTLYTDQTITGEKTFDNPLLIHSGPNPIFRIKATSNQSILNFRNFTNEDQAGIVLDTPLSKLSIVTRTDNTDIEINPHGTGSIVLPNVASGTGDALGLDASNNLVKISSTSSYKLLDEDITPTAFTSATFLTILTGGILGTNSFDGAVDSSFEGEIWIKSVDSASSNFNLRFTIFGTSITANILLGSGSQTWLTLVKFKLIIQGGIFLIMGQTTTMLETSNFENVRNINHATTTYTATGTSSIDILAQCLGTGSPTIYMTSFKLDQIT